LFVVLIDVNDNYPVFVGLNQLNGNFSHIDNEDPIFEMYEKVEENSKLNTKIVQLKAIDLDKYRNISYQIAHSSPLEKLLKIDSATGKI
jgi:protein subunit release factor A